MFVVKEKRWNHRDTALLFPDNGCFRVADSGRANGADRRFFESGDAVDETVANDNARHNAFALAVNRPETRAVFEIESLHHIASAADQDLATFVRHDVWRDVRNSALA